MNITHRWKKLMAVGCTHGYHIDEQAKEQAIGFAQRWKPDLMIHLGDFLDLAAYRTGAKGSKDEAEDQTPDTTAAWLFMEKWFGASPKSERLIIIGNHEARLWDLSLHYNEIIRTAASFGIKEIREAAKHFGAKLHEDYNVHNGWVRYGDTLFGHGYMFNDNYARDHAETFGRCVIAHGHRAMSATGRRADHPVCFSVGTLSNVEAMRYAARRRATLSWSHGWVFGEYCETQTALWLITHEQKTQWRLPL